MDPDEEPGAPEETPSPQLPPDPISISRASSVQLHESYLWLRGGGFSMTEALLYLAASAAVNTMIAAQEAAIILAREMPEPPERDG